ncbi:MAG: VOC family protein [Planctomycetia bacterium]|nr:VOC family protein [Planctomycetia bacterium]
MPKAVKPVPDEFSTISVHLVVPNSVEAMELYAKAFGAVPRGRMAGPDGKSTMHAAMQLGKSMIMMTDENLQWGAKSPLTLGGTPVTLHYYVEDADAAFDRAVKAGCTVKMPLADMFWGDRYGIVADPYGHNWSIATHKEDLTHEQIKERACAAMGAMAK